jgi:hypothetical protein
MMAGRSGVGLNSLKLEVPTSVGLGFELGEPMLKGLAVVHFGDGQYGRMPIQGGLESGVEEFVDGEALKVMG